MTAHASPEMVNCPHCGAKNPDIADDCSECGRPLTVFIGPRPKVRRCTLRTAMILVAAIAVCLGIARQAPGLGIPFLLVLVPATIRTILDVAEREADGRPMQRREKFGAFLGSIGLVVLLNAVGVIVFVVTFVPLFFMSEEMAQRGGGKSGKVVALLVGGLAALAVVSYCGVKTWPRKD